MKTPSWAKQYFRKMEEFKRSPLNLKYQSMLRERGLVPHSKACTCRFPDHTMCHGDDKLTPKDKPVGC